MRKINLYSSRQKALRGEVSDVFQYDEMPDKLRVQIKFILDKCLGSEAQYYTADWPKAIYNAIYETLIEEYGQLYLSNSSEMYGNKNCYKSLNEYLINEPDVELVLDYIELAFKHVNGNTRHYEYLSRHNHSEIADNAIELLNLRFKENGCGYQFEDGQIFRVDSTHIHKEIIKPAISLLNDERFYGAQDEFLNAFDHFRHKKYKECLVDCLKAFESTMKSICEEMEWELPTKPKPNAGKLIQICMEKELIPQYWQQQLTSLRSNLESGIPTCRNIYAHGQGKNIIEAQEQVVSFTLNMTASTIVFLINSFKKIELSED